MILVFAGVQADLPGSAEQRLPQRAEDALRRCIEDLLRTLGPRLMVGAAATGSDIIIAEAALSEGIPVRIVLPFAESDFEEASVLAHGRRWIDRFRALLDATGPAVAGGLDPTETGVFERHNQVLLDHARAWAEPLESVQALAIRPAAGGTRSTTDDFAERCHRLAIPLLDVDPLDVDPLAPGPLAPRPHAPFPPAIDPRQVAPGPME